MPEILTNKDAKSLSVRVRRNRGGTLITGSILRSRWIKPVSEAVFLMKSSGNNLVKHSTLGSAFRFSEKFFILYPTQIHMILHFISYYIIVGLKTFL